MQQRFHYKKSSAVSEEKQAASIVKKKSTPDWSPSSHYSIPKSIKTVIKPSFSRRAANILEKSIPELKPLRRRLVSLNFKVLMPNLYENLDQLKEVMGVVLLFLGITLIKDFEQSQLLQILGIAALSCMICWMIGDAAYSMLDYAYFLSVRDERVFARLGLVPREKESKIHYKSRLLFECREPFKLNKKFNEALQQIKNEQRFLTTLLEPQKYSELQGITRSALYDKNLIRQILIFASNRRLQVEVTAETPVSHNEDLPALN